MDLNSELWMYGGVILGTVFVTLAGLAANAWAGTKLIEQGKRFTAALKANRETIYKAVDDASDPINVGIANATPWKDDPAMISAMLKAMVEVALQYRPPQEIRLSPLEFESAVNVKKQLERIQADFEAQQKA